MKTQVFNGGLSTRLASHLIAPNEAVEYANVDSSVGYLAPVKTKADSTLVLNKFAHYFEAIGLWEHSATERHYLEHQQNLYYTEPSVVPKYFDGTTHYPLGISKPTVAIAVSETAFGIPKPTSTATVAVGAAGLLTGTYKYVVTYFNSNDNVESLASALSINVTVAAEKVDLSAIPVSPDNQANLKRLYRVGGTITELILVATISNSNTTYTDNYPDATALSFPDNVLPILLSGTYTYVITYYNNVKGIESQPSIVSAEVDTVNVSVDLSAIPVSSDSQVDQRKIYRVGGNLTSYSLVATIADNTTTTYTDSIADTEIPGDDMVATDYRQAPAGLKYLTEAYGIMFGVLGDKLYYTPPGVFTAWPATYFIDFAIDITGIAVIGTGLLVFDKYKTYIITGTSHATFNKRPFSGDQGCLSFDSIQYVKGSLLWVSSDGICTVNGSLVEVVSKNKLNKVTLDIVNSAFHDEVYYALKVDGSILAYDFRFGPVIKDLNLAIDRLVVANDILYGYSGGIYYPLFGGATNESFTYKSPKFTEGSLTARKTYKSIYIQSIGDVTIEVFITGVSRQVKILPTDFDSHEVKLPEKYKEGYSIQFKLTGTGEVYEIDYGT